MNDVPKVFASVVAAIASWFSLATFSTVLACIASVIAILAGLPVAVDRWRHKLPAWITRHFPAAQ